MDILWGGRGKVNSALRGRPSGCVRIAGSCELWWLRGAWSIFYSEVRTGRKELSCKEGLQVMKLKICPVCVNCRIQYGWH